MRFVLKSANKRVWYILFFTCIAYCIITALCILLGDSALELKEIIRILVGLDADIQNLQIKQDIIFQSRLPRIVMAILIGMLLASSGVVVQGVFANPIADPYIIGIASSATFGAIVAFLLQMPDSAYGWMGFVCSVVFSLLLFRIAKDSNTATLLIVGIALSSFVGAFTSFFSYYIGEQSFKITAWLMGYLGLASWRKICLLLLPLLICLIYFYIKRNELNILLSGDDEATSLGLQTQRVKISLLIVAAFGVSFAVAFSGIIAFVGLIIPHSLRLLLRSSSHHILIPLSILVGGVFLLFCDFIARVILYPTEIPIGIITAFFGAPFFLYIALKQRGM